MSLKIEADANGQNDFEKKAQHVETEKCYRHPLHYPQKFRYLKIPSISLVCEQNTITAGVFACVSRFQMYFQQKSINERE